MCPSTPACRSCADTPSGGRIGVIISPALRTEINNGLPDLSAFFDFSNPWLTPYLDTVREAEWLMPGAFALARDWWSTGLKDMRPKMFLNSRTPVFEPKCFVDPDNPRLVLTVYGKSTDGRPLFMCSV